MGNNRLLKLSAASCGASLSFRNGLLNLRALTMRQVSGTLFAAWFKVLWLLSVLCFTMLGCSWNIPVSTKLQIQNPPEKKIFKKVLVVMSKEQAEKVVTYRHSAIASPMNFDAGKSISSNLVIALQSMYQQVDFSHDFPPPEKSYDHYILPTLKDCSFDVVGALSAKKIHVFIDYAFLDAHKKPIQTLETDGSSLREITGSEKATTSIAPFITPLIIVTMVNDLNAIGQAWDIAVGDSISQLMGKLYNYSNK